MKYELRLVDHHPEAIRLGHQYGRKLSGYCNTRQEAERRANDLNRDWVVDNILHVYVAPVGEE